MIDPDEMTLGQLLAYPYNFGVKRLKLALWKVGGIKIERTRAQSFFLGTDKEISQNRKFFTLRLVTRKRKRYWDGP